MDAHSKAGEIRRFGSVGPLYEVLSDPGVTSPDADVRIRLIETGELADYPWSQLIRDPVVH